ncbi:MAG: sigma-70 family RNA polymerase sigma factor [Gemmatimonadota bacterium]
MSTGQDVAALFHEHNAALHRYLLRLTGGDDARATDAVQHAFLRLLEAGDDVRNVRNVRAWLYRVGTNAIHEWTNTAQRREDLMSEHAHNAPGPKAADAPDESLERAERIRAVRAALDELPERDRIVLLMREEGFKHREIAEAVGTTTGSVGTLIARALDRLAGALDLDRAEAS